MSGNRRLIRVNPISPDRGITSRSHKEEALPGAIRRGLSANLPPIAGGVSHKGGFALRDRVPEAMPLTLGASQISPFRPGKRL